MARDHGTMKVVTRCLAIYTIDIQAKIQPRYCGVESNSKSWTIGHLVDRRVDRMVLLV